MRSEEGGAAAAKQFAGVWQAAAKICDSCKSAVALLFCRVDSAFLCVGCDADVHAANTPASRHERVWMCEVCEQAPASFTCKADAAVLCVTCDADIHAANPLARRHERLPVVPFQESAASALKSAAALLKPNAGGFDEVEMDAASWLLEAPDPKSGNYFFPDVDPDLGLDYDSSFDSRFEDLYNSNASYDSVVPFQTKTLPPPPPASDADYPRPKPCFSYTAPSLSHSVSSSSLDIGVVPDGADVSFAGSGKSGTEPPGSAASSGPVLNREARVLRYREKRKNQKFEKTIRYASRKAYAETRPRIKGRFAKRTEMDADDQILYAPAVVGGFISNSGYGVVPSF